MADQPMLFALGDDAPFGRGVASHLGTTLGHHEERHFEDGEHKARPLETVRGRDVYVLHSLYGDGTATANDKLCRLLFFCGACRDAGAASVTAVTPYLCYARKDRRTKAHDPVTTRYVAAMMEAVGISRVMALEAHNPAAFDNAHRIPADHLDAHRVLANHLAARVRGDVTVISPDAGGMKRAESVRRHLTEALGREVGRGFMEKHRSRGVVTGDVLAGEVAGTTAVIVDDLIASGGTLQRAARTAREQGATGVIAAATHGLFVEDADATLADDAFDAVIVTNSVPAFRLTAEAARGKLTVLDVTPLVGAAIARVQTGGSLAELLGTET
ncbi:ribose-phosphate pyrophosphokinase [Limimonas halophila]|uniref:ribose-phosphate diphosphokinase n=1 Tax=Limimonas halophila TaxID=1082479 RepID=A0A1G7M6G3_9PROT|nr:ribose-phosphate diphosphokinase [Limimonas halophila]SDF57311.1 ribose-phosphate pyrophosphokinase [Limimonas halophila]